MEHYRKCMACGVNTHWQCPCGYPACRAGAAGNLKGKWVAKCDGYFKHIRSRLLLDMLKGVYVSFGYYVVGADLAYWALGATAGQAVELYNLYRYC